LENWKLGNVRKDADEAAQEAKRRLEVIRTSLTGSEGDEPSLKSLWVDLQIVDVRGALAAGLCEFHDEFVRARRERNALSFSDCEMEALRLVERNPEVRDRLRSRYKYVLVDEYQDINPLQQALIFALCDQRGETKRSPNNLYVVGDERQSIFGFRDADCRLIAELRREKGTECRSLRENFRSRPQILDFVNSAFGRIWASSEMGTSLVPAYPGYQTALPGECADIPRIELHLVKATDAESGRALEAWAIAKRLWKIVKERKVGICQKKDDTYESRPVQWGDCAVLVRVRDSLSKFEEALGALGIPFRTESGGGFWALPEISDIRALLMCMSPLADDIDWAILLRSPWVGISDDGLLETADAASEAGGWSEALREVKLSDEADRARLDAFKGWLETVRGLAGRVPVGRLLEEALRMSEYSERVFGQANARAAMVWYGWKTELPTVWRGTVGSRCLAGACG
jgi:ATP-dependent exoDNAse (exonuclease V) beta subunit